MNIGATNPKILCRKSSPGHAYLEMFRRVDGLLVARIPLAQQEAKWNRVIDRRFAAPLAAALPASHARGTLFLQQRVSTRNSTTVSSVPAGIFPDACLPSCSCSQRPAFTRVRTQQDTNTHNTCTIESQQDTREGGPAKRGARDSPSPLAPSPVSSEPVRRLAVCKTLEDRRRTGILRTKPPAVILVPFCGLFDGPPGTKAREHTARLDTERGR